MMRGDFNWRGNADDYLYFANEFFQRVGLDA